MPTPFVDLSVHHDPEGVSDRIAYGFTKMLWLRENRPDVWANTRYFLPPNAYVIYLLTGEIAVDHLVQ